MERSIAPKISDASLGYGVRCEPPVPSAFRDSGIGYLAGDREAYFGSAPGTARHIDLSADLASALAHPNQAEMSLSTAARQYIGINANAVITHAKGQTGGLVG